MKDDAITVLSKLRQLFDGYKTTIADMRPEWHVDRDNRCVVLRAHCVCRNSVRHIDFRYSTSDLANMEHAWHEGQRLGESHRLELISAQEGCE